VRDAVPPGEVVILNGTTSAGKTTLAVELQAQLAAAGECWLVWGIDDFLAKLPVAWLAYDDEGEHADAGIRFDRVDGGITFRPGRSATGSSRRTAERSPPWPATA
jgi:chloramphenicol 3-O-phosphotransferase